MGLRVRPCIDVSDTLLTDIISSGDTWGIGPEAVKQRYNELANRNPKPNTMLTLNHDVHETTASVFAFNCVGKLANLGSVTTS